MEGILIIAKQITPAIRKAPSLSMELESLLSRPPSADFFTRLCRPLNQESILAKPNLTSGCWAIQTSERRIVIKKISRALPEKIVRACPILNEGLFQELLSHIQLNGVSEFDACNELRKLKNYSNITVIEPLFASITDNESAIVTPFIDLPIMCSQIIPKRIQREFNRFRWHALLRFQIADIRSANAFYDAENGKIMVFDPVKISWAVVPFQAISYAFNIQNLIGLLKIFAAIILAKQSIAKLNPFALFHRIASD